MVAWWGRRTVSAALGFVVYWAVKAAVRTSARDAVDEVVVRLLDYGWQPPGGLTPEATEIRRQDEAERDRTHARPQLGRSSEAMAMAMALARRTLAAPTGGLCGG